MNAATTRRVWTAYESPFGRLTLTASGRGLDGLYFAGRAPNLKDPSGPQHLAQAIRQLDEYFAGTRQEFDLPLDLRGTPFQQAVWAQLQAVPYGATITYGDLASRIRRPDRIRAAGAAVGRNPLPIIVPCHRVIAADGNLTGYLGGLHRKQALLGAEDAVRHGNGATIPFGTCQLALL